MSDAKHGDRVATGDPAVLAAAFDRALAGLEGLQRALRAWALARDTLEANLVRQRVDEGACRKGCGWCCRLDIEVRFADAFQLAKRAAADPVLEKRLRATAARVAGLDAVGRLRAAVPCAFLDPASQVCAVYADRPLACRAYRSRDADWCRGIVGADDLRAAARSSPVVQEALAIRSVIQQALVAVTPPEWRGKGELHAMTLAVLDRLAGPPKC